MLRKRKIRKQQKSQPCCLKVLQLRWVNSRQRKTGSRQKRLLVHSLQLKKQRSSPGSPLRPFPDMPCGDISENAAKSAERSGFRESTFRSGWRNGRKEKWVMASIKERNGKYCVIYNTQTRTATKSRNGKPTKQRLRQNSGKRKLSIRKVWGSLSFRSVSI